MSSIFIINTMKSFANDRALSHGGATSQRSKMNLTVATFKTMVNTKKPIISKILSQSPFRLKTQLRQPAKRAGRVTLSVLCTLFVRTRFIIYGNRIILYSECLKPKYSLFILFFKPLFIIHYSASTPEDDQFGYSIGPSSELRMYQSEL